MDLVKIELNELNKIPFYYQITEYLHDQIKKGDFNPGDSLPPERELCEQFGVSRGTIRQAINILAIKGFVRRKQGKGTVITHPTLEHDLIGDYSFGKGMIKQGLKCTSKVLAISVIEGKKAITTRLKLPGKARLIKISRIRYANDEPWIIEDSYLPEKQFPGLYNLDFTSHLLVENLVYSYNTLLSRVEAFVEPTIAEEDYAELLGLKIGSPALVLDRVLFNDKNEPVVYSHAFIRGDRCRYYFKVSR